MTDYFALAKGVLTAKQFEAWELYHRKGRSYQQIAYMLDLDRSTVVRRVKRANYLVDRKLRQNGA